MSAIRLSLQGYLHGLRTHALFQKPDTLRHPKVASQPLVTLPSCPCLYYTNILGHCYILSEGVKLTVKKRMLKCLSGATTRAKVPSTVVRTRYICPFFSFRPCPTKSLCTPLLVNSVLTWKRTQNTKKLVNAQVVLSVIRTNLFVRAQCILTFISQHQNLFGTGDVNLILDLTGSRCR